MLLAYSPAQLTNSDSTLIKKPKTAFYLSLIPGGGQLYNEKFLKGSILMGLESFAIYSFFLNTFLLREDSRHYNNLCKYLNFPKMNK